MKIFKIVKHDNSVEKNNLETESNEILTKQKKNYVNKFFCHKENLFHKKFLVKKVRHSNVYKHKYNKNQNLKKNQKEGRWTLKEHIIFLQSLEKYGTNWLKISEKFSTRIYSQIRSHAQKFYRKLKEYKDTELGIDFTSKNIKDFNDMIKHIKSVNKNYNIVTVFLYISEKCNQNVNSIKNDKVNNNININNILCEDITKNIINNFDIYYENNNKNINKEINNNLNNVYNNDINNMNYGDDINNFVSLDQVYLNNDNTSNFLNNILLQNISCNNIDILNNYCLNNTSVCLLDVFCTLENKFN